jgi:hypothetical protein
MISFVMTILNRHRDCIGLTLFRWKNFRLELWYCPKNFVIEEHCHPSQDIELMYLYGETTFCRRKIINNKMSEIAPFEAIDVSFPKYFGKKFTVSHDDSHWFSVRNKPLIFLNFQRFLPGKIPVSAAVDFKESKDYAN